MVKMELSASQSQSTSTLWATNELVEAIQGLVSAVGKVDGISSFKGVAASKAKEYGQSYIVPAATAAETLVKGVVQDVAKLTQKYMSDVDGKSHDSEKLKKQMQQIAMAQSALDSAMGTAKSIPDKGVSGTIISALQGKMSANDAKAKKYKKLYDDFMKYDGTSSDIFSDLDDLESAFNTGISEILKGFNKGAGTYGEFDTSQSRAWTVAASNDENNISKKVNKIDKTNSSKISTTNLLFKQLKSDAVNNTLSAGIAILGQSGEAKVNNIVVKGPKQGRSFVMYDPSHQVDYASGEGAIELSDFAGKGLMVLGAMNTFNTDTKKEHETSTQSCVHIAGNIITSSAAGKITEVILSKLCPEAGAAIGVVKFLSSLVTGAYYESRYNQKNSGLKSKINSFGNYLDKEVKNFDEKMEESQDYPGQYKYKNGGIVYELK